jgi:anti-sigma factor RsiW
MLGALSDYVDGELEARLCAEIEAHMRGCPDCQVMIDTLRKTIVLYRTHGHTELPTDVQRRLYAVLELEALAAGQNDSLATSGPDRHLK